MLSAIQNNPFRYIGVYSNTSAKEQIANISRIKAFCKVGKDLDFPTDLNALLPQMERSEQFTNEMANKVNLPKDKLRHSLTWFINVSDNDKDAMRLLQKGLIEQAMSQLYRIQDFSSLINRGVVSFLMGKDIEGTKLILQVIHDTEYRQQFIMEVCGPTVSVQEQELAEMFIDELHKDIPALILSRMLRQKGILQSDLNYVNSIIIEKADTFIHSRHSSFHPNTATIADARRLLDDCAPYIANLREAQGKNGTKYLQLSTLVEQTVLNVVIGEVNSTLNNLKKPTSYLDQIIIKNELVKKFTDAWATISMLDKLDVNLDAKDRLLRQMTLLRNLFGQLELSTPARVDFQLMTERDLFEACNKKEQYEAYVKRFPSGDFTKKALIKIEELKRKEMEKRQQLIQRIADCQTTEEASDALANCKDEETRLLADDKYFSLCATKADFRSYLEEFDDNGRHSHEAKSHLRLELKLKHIKDLIVENEWWSIGIAVILLSIVWGGIAKGYEGLASAFMVAAFIMGLASIIMMRRLDNNKGCASILLTAGLAVGCIFISMGFKRCERQSQKEKEATVAYENLMKAPSLKACDFYVDTYPESEKKEEVMAMYYNYVNDGGLKTLSPFYTKYAGTPWGDKAEQRRKAICDSLYAVATLENSVSGWERYQEAVPSDFFADSQQKIDSLENLRWNTDETAWKAACDDNTTVTYQKYLDLYPKGKYKKQAEKKLIDAQVNDILAGEHGSLVEMDRVSYSSGITSTVSVKNNTPYTMTLLYSGPGSKRLVLPPHQSSSLTLKNGTYRVAASVSDVNVQNYAGTQTLQGGGYSVEYYISTTTIPRFRY